MTTPATPPIEPQALVPSISIIEVGRGPLSNATLAQIEQAFQATMVYGDDGEFQVTPREMVPFVWWVFPALLRDLRAAADALDRAAQIEHAARALIDADTEMGRADVENRSDDLALAFISRSEASRRLYDLLGAATARPSAGMETAD